MKQRQSVTWILLTAVMLGSVPAPLVLAQEVAATATLRLSATRGRVEVLANGQWQKLQGPMDVQTGTAVRTAPGAEAVARFGDGSSITLGAGTAVRFADTGRAVRLKVMGQLTASISPTLVAGSTIAFDTPTGRATINKAFAVARAVRTDVASGLANVTLQTPTARAVRLAVLQGGATLQAFYNISGVVTGTDPEHGSFTVTEAGTSRARRVVVGQGTLLARKDPKESETSRATRSPRSIVEALATRQPVIIYGEPTQAEGPGDLVAQAGTGAVNATVVFPEGADYLSAEDFVQTGDIAVVGVGVAAAAGNTLSVTAGSLAPAVTAGTALAGTVATQVAVSSATGLAAAGPLAIGLGVVGVAAAVDVVSNNNKANNNNVTTTTPTSTTLNLVLGRVASRSKASATLSSSAFQPASTILASSPFRGGTVGPTLSVAEDGVVGRLPLTGALQLHAAAQISRNGMESNMTQMDVGLDYLLSPTRSLGAALVTQNVTAVDGSSLSNTTPQLRYTIRF